MKALVPRTPDKLGGPFTEAENHCFEVLAERDKAVVIQFHAIPEGVKSFDT